MGDSSVKDTYLRLSNTIEAFSPHSDRVRIILVGTDLRLDGETTFHLVYRIMHFCCKPVIITIPSTQLTVTEYTAIYTTLTDKLGITYFKSPRHLWSSTIAKIKYLSKDTYVISAGFLGHDDGSKFPTNYTWPVLPVAHVQEINSQNHIFSKFGMLTLAGLLSFVVTNTDLGLLDLFQHVTQFKEAVLKFDGGHRRELIIKLKEELNMAKEIAVIRAAYQDKLEIDKLNKRRRSY